MWTVVESSLTGQLRLKMTPRASVRAGAQCVVVEVLNCGISISFSAKRNRRKRSVRTRKRTNRRSEMVIGKAFKRTSREEQTANRNCMRMSVAKFEELLQMVGPKIQKSDTVFRTLILARTKLEPTLRHLARGDNITSLNMQSGFLKIQYTHF